MRTVYALSCLLAVAQLPPARAWGAAGHEIVATIAEIHLLPSVLSYLRAPDHALLPAYADGHLAPIASWPDRIRGVPEYRGWSGPLHYTGWEGDHPPEVCAWPAAQAQGDGRDAEIEQNSREADQKSEGHWNSEHDVLHAIANYTSRLEADPTDWVSLRFLVHFLGDVHQPLHLTSRERGGNGDPVLWEGRRTNMHSLWDGLLIARALRETNNYTKPLPSQQIEDALTGRIYDPYVRLLLWEGVRSWWRDALPTWLSCALAGFKQGDDATVPSSTRSDAQLAFLDPGAGGTQRRTGDGDGDVICPFVWASETHRTTCALGFPANYDDDHYSVSTTDSAIESDEGDGSNGFGRLLEVGGQSPFYRKIRDTKAVERLLVQGGLRLAATLNTIFAPVAVEAGFSFATDAAQEEAEQAWTRRGVYWGWLQEEEGEAH
ncbi:hypothetical protein JCM8202v2_005370 [Rhodotorula sphaerocarpa]